MRHNGGLMTDQPELIGPYKILQKIGEGGFATVYLAQSRDPKKPQKVALKVLNSGEGYRRFEREVETVAMLDHPNIIRIFDTGEDKKTGVPFFAMEYIAGGTLRNKLEADTRLSRQEAMTLIKPIGAALTYAHEQGIIHRDVNANNILLDTSQDPIRPVLTDFGLVKSLVSEDDNTSTVGIIGTFHYYAPEQWNRETLTPATDLYALAITLFEALSGQRPFKGDIFALRDKHLDEPFPSLSGLVPDTGPYFEDILIKAAAKEPSDRYPSVAEFVEALIEADRKATDDQNYKDIQKLVEHKDYATALERLNRDFIHVGNFEYRNVAQMLWGLVYANQHHGALPPGWDGQASLQAFTEPISNMDDMVVTQQSQTLETLESQLSRTRRDLVRTQEISKVIIPISLWLAILVGGIIAPQIQGLSPQIRELLAQPFTSIIAFVLLAGYLIYYFWVYYISTLHHD
jgi:serine/threonine protein kinase